MESTTPARRGTRATRIEALTDAVFGFAITLLVVSLEVPATFDDLVTLMRGFVAFAASFALLLLVWYYHYELFARFPLEDGWTVFLNAILLFVVLFYVYPLKFVFTSWLAPNQEGVFSAWEEVPLMMTIYGLGFVLVFVAFGLLFLNAWRQRDRLGLDRTGALDALGQVANCAVMVLVGLLSVAVSRLAPLEWAAAGAGFTYFIIGPLQYLRGWYFAKRQMALENPL